MNRIITVGREFGSGGREIGRKIAQELGIAYYDHETRNRVDSPDQFGGKNTSAASRRRTRCPSLP